MRPAPAPDDDDDGLGDRPLTDAALRMLARTSFGGKRLPPGVTVCDLVAASWVGAAVKGDMSALRHLLERVEGKVTEPAEKDDLWDRVFEAIRRGRECLATRDAQCEAERRALYGRAGAP
jgi:hypothetical protein